MGIGTKLGQRVRQWLEEDASNPQLPRALANRLIDALGSEDWLKAPIRDLCSQPLLLEGLRGSGTRQESALTSLRQQLGRTYAPAVLAELLDLLTAASGIEDTRETPRARPSSQPARPTEQRSHQRAWQNWQTALAQLRPLLLAMAPGIALAAVSALVFAWVAGELDKKLFDAWGWSSGLVLVLILGFAQLVKQGLQKSLKRRCSWGLDTEQALLTSEDWRWCVAPWIHERNQEAALNLVVLLLVLGGATAPLKDVVFRYVLTALATMIPAVWLANRWQLQRQWSGAVGPISALISLAATLSLLHGKTLGFATPLLTLPAWVLLLVYGALQLNWQLVKSTSGQNTKPMRRLLTSQWTWGLVFGLVWAVVTWATELVKATSA